jgi:hypothetical protein
MSSYEVEKKEAWLEELEEKGELTAEELHNARRLLFSPICSASGERIRLTTDAEKIRKWLDEDRAEDIANSPTPAKSRFIP